MTEVREGDRVRLTTEGTVAHVYEAVASIKTDAGGLYHYSLGEDAAIVEVLKRADPPAFPVGSVVKARWGGVALRQRHGWVWSVSGAISNLDDEEFRRLVSKGIAEVLYEPAS